jgi:hypothetical protein
MLRWCSNGYDATAPISIIICAYLFRDGDILELEKSDADKK